MGQRKCAGQAYLSLRHGIPGRRKVSPTKQPQETRRKRRVRHLEAGEEERQAERVGSAKTALG